MPTSSPSTARVVLTILAASVVSLIVGWWLVPQLNDLEARTILGQSSPGYWPLRLKADLINTLLVHLGASLAAIRISRANPFIVVIPMCAISYLVWYTELGGYSCIGNCGFPTWYDALSLPNQFLGGLIAAFLALRSNNSFKPNLLRSSKSAA